MTLTHRSGSPTLVAPVHSQQPVSVEVLPATKTHASTSSAATGVDLSVAKGLLQDVERARTHQLDPIAVAVRAAITLADSRKDARKTPDLLQRQRIETLQASLKKHVIETPTPSSDAWPSPEATHQLNTIAQAASSQVGLGTVLPQHVTSYDNAMLGPVLHTGDEIWAASAACIRGATKSVQLQTWAYHRRSESARHIMGALADLQHQQAIKRDRGEQITPIDIEIVRGSARWGNGPDTKTGGHTQEVLASALAADKAGTTQWHYGIFPFAVDPELLRVSFSEREHKSRGAIHSKTLLIDNAIGVMTSANVKGSHHRVSTNNAPFHDFGLVIAGDAVSGAMQDDFRHAKAVCQEVGGNTDAATLSIKQIEADLVRAAPELAVASLAEPVQRIIDDKVKSVTQAIAQWQQKSRQTAAQMVALSKAPYSGVYGKAPDSPQRRAFLAAMDAAKCDIEINNANFNADEVIEALKRAMDRGVNVHIVASEHYNDKVYGYRPGANTNREVFDLLINYRIKKQSPGGLNLRWHPDKQGEEQHFKSSHTKAMFIDGQVAIFGSANLDAQSWSYSGEFNLATSDPAIVHQLHASLFAPFWATGRRKVSVPNSMRAESVATPGNTSTESLASLAEQLSAPVTQASSSDGLSSNSSNFSKFYAQDDTWQDDLFDTAKLNQDFRKALVGQDLSQKDAFLQRFNKYFAPRLNTEEVAIERLVMKTNRLYASAEATFDFNIDRNVLNEEVGDYASSYRRSATFVSAKTGVRANLYTPVADAPDGTPLRAIIAYQGLTFRPDGLARKDKAGIGMRDAFDPRGVGHDGFAKDGEQLLAWSRNALQDGRPVTITGFSLGGSLATRHLAAHTAAERGNIRLLTYAAPGIDKKTADKLTADTSSLDARHFRTRKDLATRAGGRHAPGQVFKSRSRVDYFSWFNHTFPTMSTQTLRGGFVTLSLPTKLIDKQRSAAVEWTRKLFSYLPLPR